MQMGFYFDQTLCIGCGECELACQTAYSLDALVSWRNVITLEEGDTFSNLSYACYHCAEPPCQSACPAKAITKRSEDGIVIVDTVKCAEAKKSSICTNNPCLKKCPYKIPKFVPSIDAGMQKCDFCLDRLNKGEKPWCAVICPEKALVSGPLNELIDTYGNGKEARGFKYYDHAKPSAVFNAMPN